MNATKIKLTEQDAKNVKGYYEKLGKSRDEIGAYFERTMSSHDPFAKYTMLHKWDVVHHEKGEPRNRAYNKFITVHSWDDKKPVADIEAAMKKIPAKLRLDGTTFVVGEILHEAFIHDNKGKLVKTLDEVHLRYDN
jgi:hypothetical protein